jgi:4'-phosphopantetheinyl transferase
VPPGVGLRSIQDVEVLVSWIDLDTTLSQTAALESTLSPAEKARADRFHTSLLRERFIAARGSLRRLLGARLAVAPELVGIDYGPHGKPQLAAHHPAVEFNVSHCGPTAVIALSTVAVGVDVERMRDVQNVESVAAEVFSPAELRALAAAADKSAAFLRGWTRKEAVLKAYGTGFRTDARALTVSLDGPVTLRMEKGYPGGGAEWTLVDVSRFDHVAALAVRAPVVSVLVDDGSG